MVGVILQGCFRSCPADERVHNRQTNWCGHQTEAQPPEVTGTGKAVAVGPSGQIRTLPGRAAAAPLNRGRVHQTELSYQNGQAQASYPITRRMSSALRRSRLLQPGPGRQAPTLGAW